MCTSPVMPRKLNQTSMTGPKALPMRLIPARCTRNSARIIASVRIITRVCPAPRKESITGLVRRPSTAVVTVTAGVSTPSASIAAPPTIAGKISHLPQPRTSAYSAKMPPSPWLLARMAMRTCFIVVSRVIVQITSDSEPMTSSCEVCARPPLPSMIDFMTYIGEVPMSP